VIEEEGRRRSQSEQNMVYGKLEVLLVSAKGLEDTDFLSKGSFGSSGFNPTFFHSQARIPEGIVPEGNR
jgi:hypothetical protein